MSVQAIHSSPEEHDNFFLLKLKALLKWLKRTVMAMLIAGSLYIGVTQAPPVHAGSYTAGDYAALVAAINAANTSAEDDTITLTGNITLGGNLPLIKSNIVFEGNNYYIDGAATYRVFFVGSGAAGAVSATAPTVVFRNLTIQNGLARGGNGSGGGAGLGGGMFVYDGAVTVQNATFAGNTATGGSGNVGGWGSGGGGMGGAGGGKYAGGGGLWAGANGGGGGWAVAGGTAGNYGGGGSGHYNGTGGAGGGAGGGTGGFLSGGGGGLNGSNGTTYTGGAGGFGGGGGAGRAGTGGNGGVGGGGGYGYVGGAGGFGGGGSFGRVNYGGSMLGGDGGFGGGGGVNGGDGGFGGGSNGGGGAGFGGGLFVRAGTLTLETVAFDDNSANHGTGVNNGQGKGGGVFLLSSTTHANGNDQGMPSVLPTISADSCDVTFSSNAAQDDMASSTDNDDVYGDLSSALDPCDGSHVTLAKTVHPTSAVAEHDVVTYTLALANTGTVSDPAVILTDTLPAEVDFGQWVVQPGSGLIRAGNTITWTGDLEAGERITFTFTATHDPGIGEITNRGYVSGTLQQASDAATFKVCGNAITVQNANDSGAGSLRQALLDICPGGVIDFAGDTPLYLSSTLDINRSLTIDGSGHAITLSGDTNNNGSRDVRVFSITVGSAVTLSHLSIVSGTATHGGGIYNYGDLTVLNSIIADNVTSIDGGGIFNRGTLVVRNSTLANNASTYGGGINSSNPTTLYNCTLVGNTGGAGQGGGIRQYDGTLAYYNTLIADSGTGGDCLVNNTSVIVANAYNLVEDGSCSASGVGFMSGDPLLGPLADNGGETLTYALLPGSPAIDAGASCLSADQRGITRTQVGGCDIGAFESRGFTLTYGGGSGQSTPVNTAFGIPLALTVSSGTGEPVDGGQVIFTGPSSGAGLSSSPLMGAVSGGIVSQSVTANGIGGSYAVTATTRGALNSVSYSLTNAASEPEIAVIGNAQVIDDGDSSPSTADHTDFGSVTLGQALTRTFTISNSGEADLSLNGSPVISLTGTGADAFSVVAQPATPVGVGLTTTFQVRFTPSISGTQVATVTIANDDPDKAPYDFVIQGTGTNQAPVADAGGDQSTTVGTVVTLDGSDSTDPDGHTLSYGWTQTGGPAVTLSNATAVSPTFTTPGTPTVLTFTLVVTDAYGLAASAADEVVVTLHDVPVSDLAVTADGPTILGQVTAFTVTAQGSNLTYTWNFGDGSPVISGSSPAITHTYPAIATYTAVVTATNGSNSQQVSIPVQIRSAEVYIYLPLVQNASTTVSGLGVAHLPSTATGGKNTNKNQIAAP